MSAQYTKYVAGILQRSGFTDIRIIPESEESGVDIVATSKSGSKVCVKCCYSSQPVPVNAVQSAYLAEEEYECKAAMVVTNSTFTEKAKAYSEKSHVMLKESVAPKQAQNVPLSSNVEPVQRTEASPTMKIKNSSVYGDILISSKIHWIMCWKQIIVATFFLILMFNYLFYAMFGDMLICFIIVLIFSGYIAYRLISERIVLTSKMLYNKRGIIWTKEISAPIDRIQNMRVKSGLLGKIFHYSDLIIDTVSGAYTIKGIKNGEEIIETFYNMR